MEMDVEEFKKRLESPEGQKHMSEIFERLAKSQRITEEITQTDDYINWLETFTIKNKGFSDDDWLYFLPEKSISEE